MRSDATSSSSDSKSGSSASHWSATFDTASTSFESSVISTSPTCAHHGCAANGGRGPTGEPIGADTLPNVRSGCQEGSGEILSRCRRRVDRRVGGRGASRARGRSRTPRAASARGRSHVPEEEVDPDRLRVLDDEDQHQDREDDPDHGLRRDPPGLLPLDPVLLRHAVDGSGSRSQGQRQSIRLPGHGQDTTRGSSTASG